MRPPVPSIVRRLVACAALGLAALAGHPVASAAAALVEASSAASEERVEAAYLYKFLSYAEWPPAMFARTDAPYLIGVAGDDAVADELARIAAGRTVGSRGVIVKRLFPGDQLTGLHMLFIGQGERARQLQWLRQARRHPILTVTDAEGALEQGSIINFRNVDERVRFEVSVDAADQAGIRLSSRLFSVATNVVKGSR